MKNIKSFLKKNGLAKNIGTDNFSLEEFDKVFTNEQNPIEARRDAFGYYSSILEVIGRGKDDIDIIELMFKR